MNAQHDTYVSPLSERYASRRMLELWSARHRYGLWRRLWLALAESERSLGVAIPELALSQMRDHLDDIDFGAVAAYEERFRHDVMAHVHAFGDSAPAARPFIHLGATSAFVTDNADLILIRDALLLLREKCVAVLRLLAEFARRWRVTPTLGYTHLQPAQLTTVGKRATLWMQDLTLDVFEIDHRLAALPFRGVKGATGTQASFLELFGGDHAKVRQLDRMVSRASGFAASIPVSGQTYTRKIDAQVLSVVCGIAASAAKFSADVRMLQAFGEIEEPFEKEQIGSSAMAYKRNPMRSERIASLARFVISLESNAAHTHSFQFFERTLDDSANRRLAIPESFLAADAILLLMKSIASGLDVHEAVIRRRVAEQLPYMSTEAILVMAVHAGKDRQAAHEIVRRHSMSATATTQNGGFPDLFALLAADPELGISEGILRSLADPARFVGRAAEQVDEFLAEVVEPLLSSSRSGAADVEEVRI
jgi:adenylosuccinate lyase